jgi:chromosome segregation ATPase
VQGLPGSDLDRDLLPPEGDVLAERVDSLAAWIHDLEAQVQASTTAGDAKTLKELAKVLDAWSKHDPKLEERVTKKIDGFSDSVNVLTQRLDTLAATVATTASGLTGREGEVAALRRRIDEDSAALAVRLADLGARVDPKPLLDLSETVRALSADAAALKRNLQRLADRTTNSTDLLAQRVEALGSSVAASASTLASREHEVAELRTAFEDWTARADATVARIAKRETEIAGLGAALAEQERALSELRTLSDGAQTHVESAVAEFRRSFNALASKVTRLDEVASPDAVQGLVDQIERLGAAVEDSGLRLDSLAAEIQAAGGRDTENKLEIGALRERLDESDARADSAFGELRQSVAGLSSRLSALDGASGETVRRLEADVDAVRAEVETVAARVGTLAATVEEERERSEAKSAEIAALGDRFEEARARVDVLVGDLQKALETMPTSSSPDPELVEGLEAVNGQLARLGVQLEQVEADSREYMETGAARDAELERLLAEGTRRLADLTRDQAEAAAEMSRLREESGAELLRVGKQLDALEATQTESAHAIRRVSSCLDDLGARLDVIEQDQADRASEVSRMDEISASERVWVRQQLEALSTAQAESARVKTDVVPLVDELAARIDAIWRERESTATEVARVSELVAGERTSLRGELEALATTLTEQLSRRSDRVEALGTELANRLDAVERAGVAATCEIERLTALQAAKLASVESRLEETALAARTAGAAADDETRDLVVELAARIDGLMGRVASLEHLEGRLQRLESENSGDTGQPEEVDRPVGDVVPIRSDA